MNQKIPATADMMARIHELGPVLREHAPAADRERRLPDASVEALEATGVFGLNTPAVYGGMGGGARAMVEAASAIGQYCTNAAWIAVISSISTVLPARFPVSLYERMFRAGAPVRMASVITSPQSDAVRDGDGYRVTGEWPFASNILHAEWAFGLVRVHDGGDSEPYTGFAWLERDQYTIRDVWHTVGMRGTGSNIFEARDAWIPADQVISADTMFGPAIEQSADASFTQRLAPISTFATTISSPPLGAAKAALALTIESARKRGITYTRYQPQSSSGVFRHEVGAVRAKIDTAEMFILRAADAIDAAAAGTEPLSPAARAAIRSDIGHATHNLGEAMNDIAWLNGTGMFAEANPLSRLWRDVHTGIRHAVTAAPINYEIGGAALLDAESPALVL